MCCSVCVFVCRDNVTVWERGDLFGESLVQEELTASFTTKTLLCVYLSVCVSGKVACCFHCFVLLGRLTGLVT